MNDRGDILAVTTWDTGWGRPKSAIHLFSVILMDVRTCALISDTHTHINNNNNNINNKNTHTGVHIPHVFVLVEANPY